jgi:hypothetical protein
MDWNYLYSIVAFVIGGFAGFQGVYERYKRDSPKASFTLPGFLYLLTRAAFPAVIFVALYASGLVDSKLLVTSLGCGTGAELFVRTKIFIKQEQKGPGNIEDVLKGPLDLLRWYQNLLLEAASTGLAQSRKAFVDKHLPESVNFYDLRERVLRNIEAYIPPLPDLKTEVEKLKDEFEKDVSSNIDLDAILARELARVRGTQLEEPDPKHAQESDLDKLERKYRYKLGYLIYNHVGPKGFNTLLSN